MRLFIKVSIALAVISACSQPLQTSAFRSHTDVNDIASAEDIEKDNYHRILSMLENTRHLQGVECGQVIDTFPVDALAAGGFVALMDAFLPDYLLPIRAQLIGAFSTKINYGVQAVKVCASCDSAVAATGSSGNDLYLNAAFNKYCGEGAYGHDMVQSGLVTYPLVGSSLDPTSIKIKPGTLPYYIFSRSTKVSSLQGPSSEWGTDVDTVFGFLSSMALGTVSISPDFMGYGSSSSAKSYIIRDAYVTATIPLVLQSGTFVSESTNCESVVGDGSFYNGVSEGGYASVALADGLLNALGMKPVSVLASSGPYRTRSATLLTAVANIDEQAFPETFAYVSAVIGAAFSSTNPSVANYGTGQDLLNAENREQILEWFADPSYGSAEFNEALANLADGDRAKFLDVVWNPDLVEFIRTASAAGEKNMCDPSYDGYVVGKNDKFCEALIQNDLIEVLETATYPVILCHSRMDMLVTFDNLPNLDSNPFLTLSEKIGDHSRSSVLCGTDALFFIASPQASAYVPDPKHTEGGGCPTGVVDTDPPTASPVIATDVPTGVSLATNAPTMTPSSTTMGKKGKKNVKKAKKATKAPKQAKGIKTRKNAKKLQ